jgi:hypothetical protein
MPKVMTGNDSHCSMIGLYNLDGEGAKIYALNKQAYKIEVEDGFGDDNERLYKPTEITETFRHVFEAANFLKDLETKRIRTRRRYPA